MIVAGLALALVSGLWPVGFAGMVAYLNRPVLRYALAYLPAFQLVPASAGFGPATVRHLLTHTAGVGFWRRGSDLLLHPGAGSGVTARSVVPLPGYYRGSLPVDVEPGTRWVYSNHGFAALGQIVEDVIPVTIGKKTPAGQPVRPGWRPRLRLGALIGSGDRIAAFVLPFVPRYREDLCLDAAAALEERAGIITPIGPRPSGADR